MENQNKNEGSNPIPSGNARTPIVINGGTNNITIIETQQNDISAVRTLESRDRVNEMTYKMVGSLVESVSKTAADFIAKKREATENPPTQAPAKKRGKVVKTKSKKRK